MTLVFGLQNLQHGPPTMKKSAGLIASERIAELPALLVDDFARNLFVGAQRVLADDQNPVRHHMFASTIRELFSYTLHHLAPDDEVTDCTWYKIAEGQKRPTRRQRVQYAIHGGLDVEFVENTLALDVDDMSANVIDAIDTLSKFTHARPDTLITDPDEISKHGEQTLLALAKFLGDILSARTAVASALEEHIHDAVYDAIAGETLPELDELSSHYSIESHDVDEVEITRIASDWIHLTADGSVTVGLQWGSNSDIRNDMGAVGEQSFPFKAWLLAPVQSPQKVERAEEGPASVDTSSWWDNYYDPEEDFRDPQDGTDEESE